MEYISSFTYCDSIQTEVQRERQVFKIVNPLQVLAPVAIPGNFSFSIACDIAGLDVHKENCLQIKFMSPDKEIIYDTGEIKFQLPVEHNNSENLGTMQFNIDMRNVVFKKVGLYSTIIVINGNQIGDYKIQVVLGTIG